MNTFPELDNSVKYAEDYISDSASVLVSISFETINQILANCERSCGNRLNYIVEETDRGYNKVCGSVRSILLFMSAMVDFGEYDVVSLNLPNNKPAPCYSGESQIIKENGTITLVDKNLRKLGCILQSETSYNVHSYKESEKPVLFFGRQLESQHETKEKAFQALWLRRNR